MIVGVDPSFRGTGVAVWDEVNSTLCFHVKYDPKLPVYEEITTLHKAAERVVFVLSQTVNNFKGADWIVEYPALSTRSGAYLAVLHGYIAQFLNKNVNVKSVTYVPPGAVDSFTNNKKHSKSYLVNFVKENYGVSGRFSHDEATALILANLLQAIRNNKYKNSYFTYKR